MLFQALDRVRPAMGHGIRQETYDFSLIFCGRCPVRIVHKGASAPVATLHRCQLLEPTDRGVDTRQWPANSIASLKEADVGIAMGHKGTEVAKEASEIVLLDDNFASIVSAVHEGRTVYDNIQKVTAWTLPTNGGEALTMMAAILVGLTMPMTPAQILWINLITTVTLGLVLAFEPP
jgi:high-affinity K+ transport system ATPase subunit B